MKKLRNRLTVIVTACMILFFAGSAFAINGPSLDFALPGNIGVRISDANVVEVTPRGLEPNFAVHFANIRGNNFEVDFDISLHTPGQRVVVEFEVYNPARRPLRVTNVISTHGAENPFGIVVSLGGDMSNIGSIIPAQSYGSIFMMIQWLPDDIEWNSYRMTGTFEFSTGIFFDESEEGGGEEPPPPEPPINLPDPPPGVGDESEPGGNQTLPEEDRPDPPQQAAPLGVLTPEEEPDLPRQPQEGPGAPEIEDELSPLWHGPGLAAENPETGDDLETARLIASVIGLGLSIAFVVLAVRNRRKLKAENLT